MMKRADLWNWLAVVAALAGLYASMRATKLRTVELSTSSLNGHVPETKIAEPATVEE